MAASGHGYHVSNKPRGFGLTRYWRTAAMEFPCPSCQHPLHIQRNLPVGETSNVIDTITGVDCPNCGFVPLQSFPDAANQPDDKHDRTLSYASQLNYAEAKQVSHFTLVRVLGQGGFGAVWLADDVNLGRQVALKLPISRSGDLSSLLHEAQSAAHLRHPNIVSIYEVGTEDDQVFIACEYIEGMTLRDLLTSGTPTIKKTVETLITIADALQYAHSQDIVHRDVKPANILLNVAGQPFITDFGLAKRIDAQSTETTISSEGQVLGTARYMSPEQASGKTKETDHRADIYALGVILFEMLTGHVPFRGNMRAVLHQKIFEDSPSPRSLDATLPKDLETICLKCLERDPDKRYFSAGDVAAELRRFHDGEPILARPISSVERVWRWCRRRQAIATLLASLFISLSVGLAGVSFYWMRAANNAALLRESLYRAQMTLAAEYVSHGDIHALRQSLDTVTRDEATASLRGFEWYYYNDLAASFLQVVNHGDSVDDIAVSTDGRQMASVGVDRNIRIWSTKDGRLIRTLALKKDRFNTMAFSPTKSQLVTGSSDGFVRFWNPAKDGDPLQQMKHGPPVTFVRFSPNGKALLSAGDDGAVRLWDVNAETMIDEIPTGKSGTRKIEFSADGRLIAIATGDGRVRLRDTQTKSIVQILTPNPNIEALAFSDDSMILVTGSYDGTLRFWSVEDGTLQDKLPTDCGLIGDLAFLKDSSLLAIVGTSGELVIYDVDERRIVRRLTSHFISDGALARSDNGRLLAVGSGDGSVKLIDTARLLQPDVCWHESAIRGAAFLDDGHFLAASSDGSVRIWEVAGGDSQTLIECDEAPVTMMAAHAGTRMIAISLAGQMVRLYDADSRKLAHELPFTGQGVTALQFSPSGGSLAIAGRDRSVAVFADGRWDTPTFVLDKSAPAATALAFSPEGDVLTVAREDGFIKHYDATTLEPRQEFQIDGVPRAIAYCPADDVLAIGTDAGLIHRWEISSGQLRVPIKAHTSRINVLRVLPNGRTIVSGSRDRVLRLWDSLSGELLTALRGHKRQVFCIAAAPDGQTMVTGSLDGAIRIWRAPREEPSSK